MGLFQQAVTTNSPYENYVARSARIDAKDNLTAKEATPMWRTPGPRRAYLHIGTYFPAIAIAGAYSLVGSPLSRTLVGGGVPDSSFPETSPLTRGFGSVRLSVPSEPSCVAPSESALPVDAPFGGSCFPSAFCSSGSFPGSLFVDFLDGVPAGSCIISLSAFLTVFPRVSRSGPTGLGDRSISHTASPAAKAASNGRRRYLNPIFKTSDACLCQADFQVSEMSRVPSYSFISLCLPSCVTDFTTFR